MTRAATRKKWTAEETLYLMERWETETDEEIGARLGRSAAAVGGRRILCGLVRSDNGRPSSRAPLPREEHDDVADGEYPCAGCARSDGRACCKPCEPWRRWFGNSWRGIRRALGKE